MAARASVRLSACASVLAQMNSTPCTWRDHVVDGVAAAAAHADHLDLGARVNPSVSIISMLMVSLLVCLQLPWLERN
jgi:hypothetical protein